MNHLLRRIEFVAVTVYRLDELRGVRPTAVKFPPQEADMNIDCIRQLVYIRIPHVVENHAPREQCSGVSHEIFEQSEFFPVEFYPLSCARHRMRERIHGQVFDGQRRTRSDNLQPPC